MFLNPYFDEIMKLKGAEELQELVRKWERLSENLKNRRTGVPIILPDILMFTEHGYGNGRVLKLIAEYLYASDNLMDFSGDLKYFEFALSYCDKHNEFSELTRLIDSVRTAAGYRYEYRGVLRIDITDWIEHAEERHFFELLEYLSVNSKNWMIVLTVSEERSDKTKDLEAIVSTFLRTEVLSIHMPSAKEFVSFARECFNGYGITLSPEAADLLEQSVDELKKSKSFHSYQTVEMLCSDVAYNLLSVSGAATEIQASDLAAFAPGSDYIGKTKKKISKRESLGFRMS